VRGFALAWGGGENTAQGSHRVNLWLKTSPASHTSRGGWNRQPSAPGSRSAGAKEGLGTAEGRTSLFRGDRDRASLSLLISRLHSSALPQPRREGPVLDRSGWAKWEGTGTRGPGFCSSTANLPAPASLSTLHVIKQATRPSPFFELTI